MWRQISVLGDSRESLVINQLFKSSIKSDLSTAQLPRSLSRRTIQIRRHSAIFLVFKDFREPREEFPLEQSPALTLLGEICGIVPHLTFIFSIDCPVFESALFKAQK